MKAVANPWIVLVSGTLFVLCGFALFTRLHHYSPSHDFDVLIFVQNWPKTVCMEWKEKDPKHKCTLPRQSNDWTVHGVWPSKFGTRGPNFCNKESKFDANALKSIINDLNEYWTDIETGGSHRKDDFWKHEWLKHGTCAEVLPPLDSELKYFKQALEWAREYNMGTVLSRKGLKPGNQYYASDFSKAVVDGIGHIPFITCTHDQRTGLPYLEEIKICFDKKLRLVDCDGIKSEENRRHKRRGESVLTNCPDKPIVYPKNVPSSDRLPPPEKPQHYLVNLYNSLTFLKWATL